jgi:3-oxoacyl-[acyl-carrier-protein] synthase II
MSLNFGSLAVQERFRDSLENDGIEKLSAKHFPSMVVSTVGGTVSQSFNLKGFNSTVVDGVCAGLSGLIHAQTVLAQDATQDAMVVVAADEVASFLFKEYDRRNWLAPTGDAAASLRPYAPDSRGWLLGEGGVALIIERAERAKARGAKPIARLTGYGQTSDASKSPANQSQDWHGMAIKQALQKSLTTPSNLDLVYGHGRGQVHYDHAEIGAINNALDGHATTLGCLAGNTGVAGATSGLYSVAAACLSIQNNEIYPVVGTTEAETGALKLATTYATQNIQRVLVTGSTENGNHNAVILSRVEEQR